MLVFTIVYAVLTTVAIGATNATDNKNKKFALIIGLVIAFGVVIPHVTNAYPPGTDVVDIINNSLPIVALVAVGIFIVIFNFGALSAKRKLSKISLQEAMKMYQV